MAGSRRVVGWLLIAVVIGTGGLIALDALSKSGPMSLHGNVALMRGIFEPGQPCSGQDDLVGVRRGWSIYVGGTDVDGPIAEGTLGDGVAESATTCRLPFVINGIPRGFEEYRLLVIDRQSNIVGAVHHLHESDMSKPQTVPVP